MEHTCGAYMSVLLLFRRPLPVSVGDFILEERAREREKISHDADMNRAGTASEAFNVSVERL